MPKPAHLDQAGERAARPHQQPAVRGFDMGAVVGDQPRERTAGPPRPRRAAPARAATCPLPDGPRISTRARADQHGGGVDGRCMCSARGAHARRQAHGEARAEHRAARRSVAAIAQCGSRPRCGRDAPRRSAWRSTGRGRNSGRSPGPAGRCRSARRSARARPAGCPGRRRRRRSRPRRACAGRSRAPSPSGGENERALSIRLLTTWPSRESWPGTTKALGPSPSKLSSIVTPSSRRISLATVDDGVEQLA